MLLDGLRSLFLQALRFDGDDATVLVSRWNKEIDYIQSVFNNMTSKKPKPPICTNEDHLNAMTTEEKAAFLAEVQANVAIDIARAAIGVKPEIDMDKPITAWLDWLKQEVDDG